MDGRDNGQNQDREGLERMEQKIPLVVVAGPTASGKTAAGVFLAQQLNGEVVSADSMQIYRHLTVGTAKPTPQEMQGVPHHLIDFLEPDQSFSVAEYVQLARQEIRGIVRRGRLPVLVGGTGLYISSLVDNIQFSESQSDPELREQLRRYAQENGPQALWERLQAVDNQAAQKIHPNNVGRVVRALEVYQTTGKTISEQQEISRREPSPYRLCMMALSFRDRQKLYDRINLRVEQMLEQGLLDEAKWLREHQVDAKDLQAIGYKELDAYLAGQEELPQAVERIQQETRRYAKRQLTWFRRDERYRFFFAEDYADRGAMHREMAQFARGQLGLS